MSLQQEWLILSVMIGMGVYVGMATDMFRYTLLPLLRKGIARSLFVLYCLCQTAIVYYILYKMNNGILRFYFFIACMLGYSMYIVFLQAIYVRILYILIRIGLFFWKIIYILIVNPITYSLYFCMRCLFYVYTFIKKCAYKVWVILIGKHVNRLKELTLRKNGNIITILCRFYSTIYTRLVSKWKR